MHPRHMNECRIFHNINSITVLLYTLKMFILRSIMLLTNTSKSNQCFKWPQFTSNPTVPTARQRIHTQAKPRPWHELENDVNVTSVTLLSNNDVNANPVPFACRSLLENCSISREFGTAMFFTVYKIRGKLLLTILHAFILGQHRSVSYIVSSFFDSRRKEKSLPDFSVPP